MNNKTQTESREFSQQHGVQEKEKVLSLLCRLIEFRERLKKMS